MAMTKLQIKSRAEDDKMPSNIMSRVNTDLARDNPSCMFVTVFLGTINLRSGQVTYTNAGHNPPLIKRVSGEVEEVPDLHGPILGVLEGKEYGESTVNLAPGDVLLVFTDGVTEALDREENLYSDERLLQTVQEVSEINADSVLKTVRGSVDEFAKGAEQADDITMIALQYKGLS
jgi:sigma-B regulation protein RsbU (phosphoserine phosphatase)